MTVWIRMKWYGGDEWWEYLSWMSNIGKLYTLPLEYCSLRWAVLIFMNYSKKKKSPQCNCTIFKKALGKDSLVSSITDSWQIPKMVFTEWNFMYIVGVLSGMCTKILT